MDLVHLCIVPALVTCGNLCLRNKCQKGSVLIELKSSFQYFSGLVCY